MRNPRGLAWSAGLLGGLTAVVMCASAAQAQEYIQDLLARDEGREYGRVVDVVRRFERVDSTNGLPLGAFRIQPTVSAGMAYDSNIFATSNGVCEVSWIIASIFSASPPVQRASMRFI